jgi:hypothetical protein
MEVRPMTQGCSSRHDGEEAAKYERWKKQYESRNFVFPDEWERLLDLAIKGLSVSSERKEQEPMEKNGWIEGNAPEKPGRYLIITGSGEVVIDEYKGGGSNGWSYGYVSHYMPIPETPVVNDIRTGRLVARA